MIMTISLLIQRPCGSWAYFYGEYFYLWKHPFTCFKDRGTGRNIQSKMHKIIRGKLQVLLKFKISINTEILKKKLVFTYKNTLSALKIRRKTKPENSTIHCQIRRNQFS